ncbi:MAG: DNA-binding protein, partial [Aeromonas veronii]
MSVWITPEECAGLPDMPTQVHNARNKLNKLATVWPDKKRPRSFGKGFEYHISLLPKETREALMLKRLLGPDPISGSADAVLGTSVAVSGASDAGDDPARVVDGVLVDNAWDELTEKQRDCALARLAFVREIERAGEHVSQKTVIRELI